MKTTTLALALSFIVALGALGLLFTGQLSPLLAQARTQHSIESRLDQYGEIARERLAPEFAKLNRSYPSESITLIGLKEEKRLEVWLSEPPQLLKSYPILAASGKLGPKLREGDLQVPEGLYRVTFLNANSLFHLSLRLGYPNGFDRAQGKLEDRTGSQLGSDIMIHGDQVSTGCLAIGDPAIEELFVLAADVGMENIEVILSPVDFRQSKLPEGRPETAAWVEAELYPQIKQALEQYPLPEAEVRKERP